MSTGLEEVSMNPQQKREVVALLGFILGVVALVMVAAPGPAYRMQWADLGAAFTTLSWGARLGIAAFALSLLGAWLARPGRARTGFGLALAGMVAGAVAFGVPYSMLLAAKKVPPIHDISTDTANPPAFVAVLARRKGASNSADYGGPEVARQQQAAFPDIQPAQLPLRPPQALERALQTARDMGWEIVATEPAEGRIEATDTTTWFGFKDDVAIRVSPQGDGSRVDVRSASRVGESDLGKNAQRVREYLAKLKG